MVLLLVGSQRGVRIGRGRVGRVLLFLFDGRKLKAEPPSPTAFPGPFAWPVLSEQERM